MLGATQIPPPYVRCIIEKTAKFIQVFKQLRSLSCLLQTQTL
ncbi:BnaC03g27620D [Brassica napus]|uniref:BnaC03g27620D protein n=2 Tax=Brassica TaxID=3705 RepID=A0A078G4Q4_BRANA|nr:BnaC03g27620D [Brassica napus]VDC80758.1 unnamed protein product [Brassica rapa]